MKPTILALALTAALSAAPVAQATRYTYHGELMDGDVPAEGEYDLRVRSFASPHAKRALGEATELPRVQVRDGSFALELDLPDSPMGDTYIEVAVRKAGSGDSFETLGTPQAVSKANTGCWALDGNTGLPAGSFLGNADPASPSPLELRARNTRVAQFTPGLVAGSDAGAPAIALGSAANVATDLGATVAGGGATTNSAGAACATCANRASDRFATVGGGLGNRAEGASSVVAGGGSNRAASSGTTIAGGGFNIASASYATIGGGEDNIASGDRSTIGGGETVRASGAHSAVLGGMLNTASGVESSVAGGAGNTASGGNSSVAGGSSNTADSAYAGVAGGLANGARASFAAVGGGNGNLAVGSFAAVPGGQFNCAGGEYSFAAGLRAVARLPVGVPSATCPGPDSGDADGDEGTFVWADSQDTSFISGGPDQFLIRAAGGVGINTAPADDGVELTVQTDSDDADYANLWLKQRSNANGILISVGDGNGSNNAGFYVAQYNGTAQTRRFELAPDGAVVVRTGPSSGMTMAAGDSGWNVISDRRLKTAIQAVDAGAILEGVAALPMSTWRYVSQSTDVRHIGPMAQDFAAAFGVGQSDTTINSIDADGVALAAIQGLNAKLEVENAALREQLDAVLARLSDIEAQLER